MKWSIEERVHVDGYRDVYAWRPVKTIEAPNLAVALQRLSDWLEGRGLPGHIKEGRNRVVRLDHVREVPWSVEREVRARVRLGASS